MENESLIDPAYVLFWVGLVWVAMAAVVAYVAGQRKQDSGTWFLLALLFSPLLMGLVLFLMTGGAPSGEATSQAVAPQASAASWSPPAVAREPRQDNDPLGITRGNAGERDLGQARLGLTRRRLAEAAAEKQRLEAMMARVWVSRGGEPAEELGPEELVAAMERGELSAEDLWWNEAVNEWQAIAAHPALVG